MPSFLFAERTASGKIDVYSHHASTGLAEDLERARLLVSRSILDDPSVRQKIFLTGSVAEFGFFAPSSRHSLGVTYHLLNQTFLAPSDPDSDTIHSDRHVLNVRPLSAVIAHERTHALLEHHFGLWRLLSADSWKQEGYCDYLAGSPSVGSDANGLTLLTQAGSEEPAVLYFRDTLRVRYLLDHDHLTVDQLFSQSFELTDLDRKALEFAKQQDR